LIASLANFSGNLPGEIFGGAMVISKKFGKIFEFETAKRLSDE
jgi:hypothetical protein